MTTVREAAFDLLRARGMTTMFGNPGSTELPMLAEFPDDFRYVLGLQEAVVVGMADGYAQASGRPDARQPAHRARRRQRDGRDLQRAGQQVAARGHRRPAGARADDAAGQPDQPRRDPHAAPAREVELRAAARRGRARTRSRARPTSRRLPPQGPVFVSIPMDDWDAEVDDDAVATQTTRTVDGRAGADPALVRALAQRLAAGAANPVLVAGPDVDASGAWDAAVALAERQRLPVWATPAPGGGRIGFPEGHPTSRASCRPRSGRSARRSRATT